MQYLPRSSAVSALVVSGVLVCAANTLAQKPSLSELAKQEEDRRKAVAAPAKVLTNGDLKPVITIGAAATDPAAGQSTTSPSGVSSTQAAGAASSGQPAGDKTSTKDSTAEKAPEAQGESYWRDRIATARSTLDQHRTDLDGLQSQINALNAAVLGQDDPVQKQKVSAQRFKVQHEVELLQKALQGDTKAVADIQEQARQAGVPPGWLR